MCEPLLSTTTTDFLIILITPFTVSRFTEGSRYLRTLQLLMHGYNTLCMEALNNPYYFCWGGI